MINYLGRNYRIQHAKGTASGTTATEMVAAVTGRIIRFLGGLFTQTSNGTLILSSDSTALTGTHAVLANNSSATPFPFNQSGWVETAAGEALKVTFSITPGTHHWEIWYIVLDPAHSSTAYTGG